MRTVVYPKIFFYCIILSIVIFLVSMTYFSNNTKKINKINKIIELQKKIQYLLEEENEMQEKINKLEFINAEIKIDKPMEKKELSMKYILQWTSPKNVPFVYMGVDQKGFIERNCTYTNCIVTSNRSYLGDYTKFDVIAFAGPEVIRMHESQLPNKRSPHQKFVFATIESADNYPICSNRLDGFFNWTWTYKLDSEAKWGYIVVRDAQKKIIGPKKEMHWMKVKDMDPITNELKKQLNTKSKAAAWFVSNCYSRSARKRFVTDLQKELRKFKLDVDIYGNCGPLKCSRDNEDKCFELIEKDYYFYLSFENSFSEDYVTEKLLHALKNNAIPVVYGGANYTRFMPDGIYLNARELGPEKLAIKMNQLIHNPEEYYEYFRWKNHYSYYRRHESVETDDYCRFCSILNEEDLVKRTSIYQNFRQWWDPPGRC